MYHPALVALLTSTCLVGCDSADSRPSTEDPIRTLVSTAITCDIVQSGMPLPSGVDESSGLARGVADPDRFWTHNDAGNPAELFAVDAAGQLTDRVRIAGAESIDWEDIEAGPCDAGSCLFIGDIGDNDAERDRITIYRVPEPAAGATESEPAEPLHARYPDGPRDAEGLLLSGRDDLYIVNKGRDEEIALYRYPGPQRPGETVTLERVRGLFPQPGNTDDYVTAATATPDGRWVGIRTYRALYIYPADALLGGGEVEPVVVDLTPLNEAQGEALVMADDGSVWVTSEASGKEDQPRWSSLRCTFGD